MDILVAFCLRISSFYYSFFPFDIIMVMCSIVAFVNWSDNIFFFLCFVDIQQSFSPFRLYDDQFHWVSEASCFQRGPLSTGQQAVRNPAVIISSVEWHALFVSGLRMFMHVFVHACVCACMCMRDAY